MDLTTVLGKVSFMIEWYMYGISGEVLDDVLNEKSVPTSSPLGRD